MFDVKMLGNRIKELRKQHGLTQNEFANMFDVSFQAVSNWERGIAPPNLENICRIALYFNILVDDLIRPCSEKLLLGIDGGGTKTEFAVLTVNGYVLKAFAYTGSNPNDPFAIKIIDRTAKRLGELLELGVNKFNVRPKAIASGGIFEHYTATMLLHIKNYTSVEIIVCDLPPIYGACMGARKLIYHEIDTKFYQNFKDSYGEHKK